MGRRRKGRDISGIIVIDKPSGITSNGVLQQVKRLYGAAKAGHTGALDPIATGVLPICLGEATKFSQRLLESDKRYITKVQLGESRDTADIEGETLDRADIPNLSQDKIESALSKFRGEITQVPPMYSALKHQGKKLYELARAGEDFDIQSKARKVSILNLELLDFGDDWLELDVTCTKGTYIRSLAEDVAKAMGSLGYVAVLRRLGAGPYHAGMMHGLEQLVEMKEKSENFSNLDQLLMPTQTALPDVPLIELTLKQAHDLQFGRAIELNSGQFKAGEPATAQVQLRLRYAQWDLLLGIGELSAQGVIAPKRLLKVPQLDELLKELN